MVQQQVAGIDPINHLDTRGRMTTIVQGTGADMRTAALAYNAGGHLASITDASDRVTQFQYDAAGRVTTQTLPDTRVIQYAYDANGNVTAVTPPGRTAHAFAHTPVDLQERYTPPDVGAGSNFTRTLYNQDRQPTQTTRPTTVSIRIPAVPTSTKKRLMNCISGGEKTANPTPKENAPRRNRSPTDPKRTTVRLRTSRACPRFQFPYLRGKHAAS
ncbi:MAG: RHS repeat domain-containing protein [Acidobacteriota bacterium]